MSVVLADDVQVWQGQYYKGTEFQVGTFEFNFTVYDTKEGGNICYSKTENIATGVFGEWKTEQVGLGAACNNLSINYFLEISINGEKQIPRRKLNLILLRNTRLIDTIESNSFQIKSPVTLTIYNRSGLIRNIIKNIDNNPNTTIVNTLENDVGYQFSLVLTSSTYNLTGQNRYNLGTISLNAPAPMWFSIRYYQPFVWYIDPANNGSFVTNQTPIMKLEPEGNLILPIGGINSTGNITTPDTGFFSFLGSLNNRITKIFIRDIDVNGSISSLNISTNNINVSNNIILGGQILTNMGCAIPHTTFWAERAGTITSGGVPAGLQYSYGDGNTNGGPVQPCSGKVVYLTVNAQTAHNGDGRIEIVINNGLTSSCGVATPSINDGKTMANCNLNFNAGETLTPRTTITPSGANNGFVVSWVVVYD